MKQGWEEKKLGDFCEVIAGQSPEGKYYNSEGIGLPFYQGKKEFKEKFIGSPKIWTKNITKEAFKDDILLSVRAPVGPVNFATDRICIGRGLAAIRSGQRIDKEFLFYFFKSQEDNIHGSTGAVFNSINKTQIENILLSVPPLPEQRRIVAILNQAFAAIAKAKENTEKNLQNTQELFSSFINGAFENPKEDWEIVNLKELCEVFADGDWIESKDQSSQGIRLIQTGNIGNGYFKNKEEKSRFITEATFKRLRCTELFKGDCLISRLPDPIGRACIIPEIQERMITAVDCTIIRFKKNKVITRYFNYYAQSIKYLNDINNQATGATRKRISRNKLGEIEISLPPLSEQQRIITKFDLVSAETQKLETIYKQKLADLEELKQSILRKAFEGDL